MFREGEEVTRVSVVMGKRTDETKTISRVGLSGVWLDNGIGNRESGPYDPNTGQWIDNGVIFGSYQRIVKGDND